MQRTKSYSIYSNPDHTQTSEATRAQKMLRKQIAEMVDEVDRLRQENASQAAQLRKYEAGEQKSISGLKEDARELLREVERIKVDNAALVRENEALRQAGRAQQQAASAAYSQLSQELGEWRRRAEGLGEENRRLSDAAARMKAELGSESSAVTAQLSQSKAREAELQQAVFLLQTTVKTLQETSRNLQEARDDAVEMVARLQAEAAEAKADAARLREGLLQAQARLSEAEGGLSRAQEELARAQAESSQARLQLTRAREEAAQETAGLREELAQVKQQLFQAEGKSMEAREEASRAAEESAQLKGELSRAKLQLSQAEDKLSKAAARTSQAESDTARFSRLLGEQREALDTATFHLREKDALIAGKDAAIAENEAALADREAAIAQKDTLLAQQRADAAAKDAALAEARATLARRDAAWDRGTNILGSLLKQSFDLKARLNSLRDEVKADGPAAKLLFQRTLGALETLGALQSVEHTTASELKASLFDAESRESNAQEKTAALTAELYAEREARQTLARSLSTAQTALQTATQAQKDAAAQLYSTKRERDAYAGQVRTLRELAERRGQVEHLQRLKIKINRLCAVDYRARVRAQGKRLSELRKALQLVRNTVQGKRKFLAQTEAEKGQIREEAMAKIHLVEEEQQRMAQEAIRTLRAQLEEKCAEAVRLTGERQEYLRQVQLLQISQMQTDFDKTQLQQQRMQIQSLKGLVQQLQKDSHTQRSLLLSQPQKESLVVDLHRSVAAGTVVFK